MAEENIGAVVVADAGRPLGVVTDRDIVVRVVAHGQDPERVQIQEVMSGQPVFLSHERGLDEVIACMRDLAIRRVPIVDEEGQLEGLVSMDDLLMLLAEQLGGLAQAIRKEAQPPI
jgi:CBS domain-containing protein